MRRIIISFFKWTASVIVLLLLAGISFEQYSRRKLEREFLKDKTFVNINGKPLHYVKKGQGNCTVIFASGMGSNHTIWQEVQDSLAKNAVTLAYDRNGLLFSEETELQVTNKQVTDELTQLLEKTNCPKPYILIGHSMAGIYMRPFIQQNKNDITAVVFAEAAHPLQLKKASSELLKTIQAPPTWFIKFVVNTGIYRMLFSFIPVSPEIPVSHRLHQLERDFFYRSYNKLLKEVDNDDLNFEDAAKTENFGKHPLTIIMGTSELRYSFIKDEAIENEYKALVNEVQRDLLHLSTDSRIVKAEHSGHIIQVFDGPLLIEEIRKYLH